MKEMNNHEGRLYRVSIINRFKYEGDRDLIEIYYGIRDGETAEKDRYIKKLVGEGNIEAADEVKDTLPAFIISCLVQDGFAAEHIKEYNSLIILDFDDIPENQYYACFKIALELPYTYMAFRSPKGKGLKIIVCVDSDIHMHSVAFKQVGKYYEEKIGVELDRSGSNMNRLCYIPHDPDAFLNTQAHDFIVDQECIPVIPKVEAGKTEKNHWGDAVRMTEKVHKYSKGSRTTYIFYLACRCRDWGIDMDEVILNVKLNYPHEKYSRLNRSIRSAYKRVHEFGKYLRTPRLVDDWHKSTLVAPVAGVAEIMQRNSNNFSLKSFAELAEHGRTLKPKGQLFGNYILEKSTVMFASERGVGKSLLVMQLAIVISKCAEIFLNERITIHGNVLYINLELNEDSVARRLASLENQYMEVDSPYKATCLTSRKGLMPLLADIKEVCLLKNPVLIIIDNLRTAFSGMDNEKNKEMTIAMGVVNELKDEIAASLVIVHHTKKGTSKKLTDSDMQSGAGSLTDLIDADFFLRRAKHKDHRLLIRKKSRDAEEQEGAKLIQINPETLWFEFLEDDVSEAAHMYGDSVFKDNTQVRQNAVELKNSGYTNADIGRELGVNRSTVKRWFDKKLE